MARKVFLSYHYEPDNWRAHQIRNIAAIDANEPAPEGKWEEITRSGAIAVKKWIDRQLQGRSCTIVLIGTRTAGRRWIEYEIAKSWRDGKGLLGIYVNYLRDKYGNQSPQGKNPFDDFSVTEDGKKLSSIVEAYDAPYSRSKDVYDFIKNNIEEWIETAISIRETH
jgi:hypothetical protein